MFPTYIAIWTHFGGKSHYQTIIIYIYILLLITCSYMFLLFPPVKICLKSQPLSTRTFTWCRMPRRHALPRAAAGRWKQLWWGWGPNNPRHPYYIIYIVGWGPYTSIYINTYIYIHKYIGMFWTIQSLGFNDSSRHCHWSIRYLNLATAIVRFGKLHFCWKNNIHSSLASSSH